MGRGVEVLEQTGVQHDPQPALA
jgi:hypothetical protein